MNLKELCYLKAFGYEFAPEFFKIEKNLNNFSSNFKAFFNLRNSVQACSLCHFSKTRKNALMEKNLKRAKVLILGLYGQKSENENGEIFSSTSGRFLQKMLKTSLNLSDMEFKEKIYFSYVFKCFHPSKIDDFSLQSCFPFFLNELEILCPKLIFLLGESVFQAFGFSDFKAFCGEILPFKNTKILPSFELEFVEKNPSFQGLFVSHLMKLKGFL